MVYVDDVGLLGSNFYWHKLQTYNLTKEQLLAVGLTNGRAKIHRELIEPLRAVDQIFQTELGYRLYVKEGYRSPELYRLVYHKRVEMFGQEATDKLMNIKDMPHADGRAVDVALWDTATDSEIFLRDKKDDPEALISDFYKNNQANPDSPKYQKLQEFVISTMQDHGFRLGKLREYFHFNYRPAEPRNYP